MTSISRIVKIGDTDISSYVEWGPRRAKGAGRRAKTSPIIGGNRAVVWQEGRDPLALKAGLLFRLDLADQIGDEDEITALIDDLAGDQETDRLYFGRTDRFAVVYGSVGDTEIAPAAGGAGIIRKTAKFWAEAAELYGATPTAWDDEGALPLTSAAIENAGNRDAGLYSLEVEAGVETALKFDGTNDKVTIADDLSGNVLSVEIDMTYLSANQYDGLFSIGDSLAGTGNLHFYLDAGMSKFGFGDGDWRYGDAGSQLVANQRIHLVLTYDVVGNEMILYEDGVEKVSWSPAAPVVLVALSDASQVIGYLTGFNYANVIFHRFRVWQRVLSAAEAEDAYDGETVDDTSLVLHYDFSEGEGDTLTDLSGEGNDGTLTNFADTSAGAGDSGDSGWMMWMMDRPEAVVLEMLDDEDAVVASIALSPALLFAEVLEVDRFGQIRQTYADGYDSGVRFGYDGFEDGTVAVTDGSLVIETSSYAGYALVGQWPLKKGGLLVTFTPTEAGAGEAFLEASIDQGDTWLEVSSNSRWVDGAENKVYVPQAEGYVEVWIRWRCDGDITSLSIDGLQIVQLRAVSDADVPKIPAGEERVLQVSGAGRAIISAEYRDRYKP